jgi:hypothetical protein
MAYPTKKFRIAERLAQARRGFQPALSQTGLAEKARTSGLADCKASRISRLEAGYADAEWSEVEALAKALGVAPQWLAGTNEGAALPVATLAPSGPSVGPVLRVAPVALAVPAKPATPARSVSPVAPIAAVAPVSAVAPATPSVPAVPPRIFSAPAVTPKAAIAVAPPVAAPYFDLAAMERSAHGSDYDYRQYLAAALSRARVKLHEAGVPAAEWRQWRAVEKRAVEELRKSA